MFAGNINLTYNRNVANLRVDPARPIFFLVFFAPSRKVVFRSFNIMSVVSKGMCGLQLGADIRGYKTP
jgi:hypothetical protein